MSNQAVTQNEPLFWSKTSFIQIGYGLWVNQCTLMTGLTFAFSAVTIPKLSDQQSLHDTVIHATLSEKAWIASVVLLSAPIGCLITGFLIDRFGRRPLLCLCLVPTAIGWFYLSQAQKPLDMIVGRIITGVGIGMSASPARIYTTEICLPNVRGVIGVLPAITTSLGITIEAVLGKLFEWRTLSFSCGIYSIFLILLNLFLPETPYFVLLKGSPEATLRTLKKFRGNDYNAENELAAMQSFKETNDLKKLSTKKSLCMLKAPYAYKPFFIILIYILVGQLSGISIIVFWTVQILKDSKISLDPYIGNILLGSTRLTSAFVTAVLIFSISRRKLALISAFGLGCICIGLGVYISSVDKPSIYPQIAYMLFIIFGSIGHYTLPLLMLNEMVPLQIRGLLGGLALSLLFLMMFASNKIFPYLHVHIRITGCLMIFGTSAFVAFLFLYFTLPETKTLTLQQIEEYYRGKRKHGNSLDNGNNLDQARPEEPLVKQSNAASASHDLKGKGSASKLHRNVSFILDEEKETRQETSKLQENNKK